MKTFIALIVLTSLLAAPVAQGAPFQRAFPGEVDDVADPAAIVALTAMVANAGPMVDDNADARQNCDFPLLVPPQDCTPAGRTYFGQFLDHDVTRDVAPLPPYGTVVDPTTLDNVRTTEVDLDSVYSVGPEGMDGAKFLIGNQGRDLPRRENGSAIIGDPRNDENQVIAQIHLAFLRLHNAFVDEVTHEGEKDKEKAFEKAQKRTVKLWRQIVMTELLPSFVGQAAVDRAVANAPEFWTPDPDGDGAQNMPVEQAGACWRNGHSNVRLAYRLAAPNGTVAAPPIGPQNIQVFNGTFGANDLTGGQPIPPARFINWPNFIQFPGELQPVNAGRRFDTKLSRGLFLLPTPVAIPGGTGSLAERNLARAQGYELPSYEDVARRVGTTPVPNPLIGFGDEMPLWYGMLYESEILEDGRIIGPTCGRVIADVFVGSLKASDFDVTDVKPSFIHEALTKAGVGPEA